MWFDVSDNFSTIRASAPGEKHHAGCQRRIVAIRVPVPFPECSSFVLWICPQTHIAHHITTITFQCLFKWIQMALQYHQVPVHFSMCPVVSVLMFKGSRVHNSIHQSDHRHGIHEPQFVVASRRFGLGIEVRIV